MRKPVALIALALVCAGCASHHGKANATSTSTPTGNAPTSAQPPKTPTNNQKSPTATTSAAPKPTTATTGTPTAHASPSAPSYSYQMSGVLPDVFPGGTGNSSTSTVTVTQTPTSSGQVFSYPASNGRLATLLVKTSSGWFKAGDGNNAHPTNCAWNPRIQELANSGSWHVDSSCTVTTAGSQSTLHLVEDAAIVGTENVVVGGHTLAARHVHRTGTLTITGSGSTSTTNFTEDVWWLTDRGVVAKATAHNTTKQSSVLSSTTTTTTGSLSLLGIH